MSRLTFHRKPMPLLAEHRPIYKITQITQILYLSSRGKKSSLIRLHLFSWALKDSKRKRVLMESAKHKKVLFGVWGVDPAVNLALQFSLAEGLIKRSGVSYELTDRGTDFASKISPEFFMQDDFAFLESLGPKITEGMVQEIVGEWE